MIQNKEIASSITLPSIIERNKEYINKELEAIIKKQNLCSNLQELKDIMYSTTNKFVNYKLKTWGVDKSDLGWLSLECFDNERMKNNIVDFNRDDVKKILKESL